MTCLPLWVSELAEAFWAIAGEPEPFPRDLRSPIACAMPVVTLLLPRLRVQAVDSWLRRHGVACPVAERDRVLRACLVARGGHGFIFLDGSDPEDEQRFSLAHELAHFLRDYWQPRRRIFERLGPAALEVIDGERLPRPAEQVHALLTHTPLGYQVHLMDRTADGGYCTAATDQAERAADLLAYELLAPEDRLRKHLLEYPATDRPWQAEELLRTRYGLPAAQAEAYAGLLFPPSPPSPLLRRLARGR